MNYVADIELQQLKNTGVFSMSKLRLLCLGLLVAVSSAGYAKAEGASHDAVYDKNGKVITAKSGNCVRTKWTQASDPCGSKDAPVAATDPNLFAAGAISNEEATIYFDFDKSNLKSTETQKLDRILAALNSGVIKNARIIGYTDPIGTKAYNDKLSKKRAESVLNYLVSKGYKNIDSTELKGLGFSDSVARCESLKKRNKRIECLWKDRRVEVAFELAKKQ